MSAVAPETPQMFGKYRLIQPLGKGGFGEVWLAYDTVVNIKVALKILHQNLMSDATFILKAKNEATLTRKIDHPNVVKVFDVGEAAGRAYVSMAYIDGRSLADRLAAGQKLTPSQVATLIEQTASALDATHAKGIVHRDVKPANLLIDSKGNVHLVDFGLAYAAQTSLGNSSQSIGMGTAKYMSPEQANGQPGDRTTDVYSLGVIAYELLAGQPPFTADNMMGYMKAHTTETPPSPHKVNPAVSLNVEKVLLKALRKKPTERYKSAGAFARDLRKAMEKGDKRRPIGCVIIPAILILAAALFAGGVALGVIQLPGVGPVISPTAVVQAQPTATVPQAAAPTRPPTAAPQATNTSAPEPTQVIEPTAAPIVPTATATPQQPTRTPLPPTNPPQPGEMVPLIGTGGQVSSLGGGATKSGQGRLTVLVRNGLGAPRTNQYVRVHTQKKDLADQWVVAEEVASGYTDNTGTISFDLAPDRYIVSANFDGYSWGTARDVKGQADIPVDAGQITQLTVSLGRLTMGFLRADGSVISNQYVRVWKQKQDLAGNWVTDDEVASGYTDNTGLVGFDLAPGYYIVGSRLDGYNWGSASDVMGMANTAIQPAAETPIILNLGQLVVGLLDPGGAPRNNQYVRVFAQTTDAGGSPAVDNEVTSGYTDNTGSVLFNLTPGKYAVRIGEQLTYNVVVEPGRITQGDGVNFNVQ